ncbi:MAG: MATE family efflux transporter [Enterobacteriaceae bacterium]
MSSHNQENLGRLFARYTIPAVLAMLVISAYQVADGIIIGHFIGTDGLAAISLVWPWFSVPMGFGLMIGMGIGTVTSIARGAGRYAEANRAIGQLYFWLLIPGSLMGALLYLLAPTLVGLQGASGKSAQYSIEYIRIIGLCCPLMIGSMATPFLIRNLNAPKLSTLFMSFGALFNIVLVYIFTVYLHWEMRGVAIAMIIAESSAAILGLCYVYSKRSQVHLTLRDYLPDWKLNRNIAMNGASSLFMYAYLGFVALLHQIMLLKYGNTEWIAAYAVIGYLLTLYYLLVEGIANGMQPIISYQYGAKAYQTVRKVLLMALSWGIGIGILFTLLLLWLPHSFSAIFIEAGSSLHQKTSYAIRLNLFALFLEGLFVIGAAFLQALNQGRQALYITVGNMLIQVPFLLTIPLYFELTGVWLAMPISNLILMIYVVRLLRQRLRVLKQQAASVPGGVKRFTSPV